MMKPDRHKVLSPAEHRQHRTERERAIAAKRGTLRWIDQVTPEKVFEALVGTWHWRVLAPAPGSWVLEKSESRLGEVLEQARRRRAIEDEIWADEQAIVEIDRRAAAYNSEHARYDPLADEWKRLQRRVENLAGVVVDPQRMPTDQELRSYVRAASEFQDLSVTLLQWSGYREQYGAASETAPAGRFFPSMHARVLSRLPARMAGPWPWQKTEQREEVHA